MSIRDKRLTIAINRILREELQKGNLPTSKEFIWRLNDYMQKQDVTKPALNPRFVRGGELAMADSYNEMIDTAYEDFTTLYAEVIEQNNKTMKNFSKFDVDKAKLDYELGLLENQLKELILLYQGSGFLSSVFDTFADFSKVDQANTTASVDIQNHEVRIGDNKNTSKQIRTNATATFALYDDIKNDVTLEQVSGTPNDALSDSLNSTWQVQILSDTKMQVGGYFYVSFPTAQTMNRMTLSLHTVKPTYARIETTADGSSWFPLPYYEQGVTIINDYTFDFPEITISRLRVSLAKTEFDGQVTRTKMKTATSMVTVPTPSGPVVAAHPIKYELGHTALPIVGGTVKPIFKTPPLRPPNFPEDFWNNVWNGSFSEAPVSADPVKRVTSGPIDIHITDPMVKQTPIPPPNVFTPPTPKTTTVTETSSYNAQMYNYVFGIKNLAFYTMGYSDTAILRSSILEATPDGNQPFTIDKVSLSVDQEVPNGTSIRYYIALPTDDPTQSPDWKAISSVEDQTSQYDQVIDFKNISSSTPTVFSVDPSISIGEYEVSSLYANGIKFYKIGEIQNRTPINGTEKLYVGKNTWQVKSFTGKYNDHETHLPSMTDWSAPLTTVEITYTKIQDGKPGLVLNNQKVSAPTSYMFTLGVFSQQANQIVTAIPASNDPIAIYMNGTLLFQGMPDSSTRVNYLFTSGWNEINVLVYTNNTVTYPSGTLTVSASGTTVDLNIDPRSYGSNVYAKAQALQKVAIFDLRYNVRMDDNTKYSIVQSGTKYQIILNTVVPGLEYEFYYNYVDGDVKDSILFRADFARDSSVTNLSPKLKTYRLRFS